ncbi:MAG: ParB/RepB/Spo0J family partition protein [Deltaproteobacteria bacterium]|jgi:ParB family transcriptional regulator, chromosome partitioning protein|nr:ParB/RepB/Spo0J family partition protein [Deltaproteobacteria bacterium]MBT4092302.1 ParB/RepB/Spo0J family partition protein [Deltaproteobacteria bacterium]MBT4268044.1 ParB/RepB/Spo0J family partition protein [Deltaproteobacteria bacterium]MBT4641488.1 ParB/RepB/Spo0J family partition protein [Deltaproteobacteria bacterium]MBT6500103.1 ParB/RepB/Spo0J family partition protein [Deltaproteobacteria bacterium]
MTNKQRKALGRGFGALLKAVEENNSEDNSANIAQLEIDKIGLNPKQPRQEMNTDRLEELAQSIRMKGVIQPILVRPGNDGPGSYELIAGERRLRASRIAGFDRIPAMIKPIKDKDLLELALLENIQRENLNALDEAKAYRALLEEHGYTQEDLAKRIGKNRSTIANLIRLLQLPESLQLDLAENRISAGHARTLLAVSDEAEQLKLRNKIVEDHISVREAELISQTEKESASPKPVKKSNPEISPQLVLNQDRLQDCFGTKVVIKPRGDKGKIELEYYSSEDFNRLYALLVK